MTCEAFKASCECSLPADHDGPHVCSCKGSWGDNGEIYGWPELYVGPPEGRRSAEAVMPLLRDLSAMFPLDSFTERQPE